MTRHAQVVEACYDRLLFSKNAMEARKAARELTVHVLGEEAYDLPLEEALRECCRELRPASDPTEQARFEAEFIEMGIWPGSNLTEQAAA